MIVTDHGCEYAGAETRAWVIDELRRTLRDRVSTASAALEQHSHDESYHASLPPDAVVFAQNTEHVSAVLRLCHAARVPVVPFGAGTSLEGGVTAPYGGISLDLTALDSVVSVSVDDMDATVEAGVTHRRLNEVVRREGAFFSVDPGADATIGGMCATRASGTTSVRYGTMRENVLALTAVLADGTVIRTGGRARKSAAGYDLTGLLVGSEGTLAVITEATVRLHPVPEVVEVATCSYPDLEAAVRSVVTALQSGVVPARIELLDDVMVDAITRFGGPELPPGPAIFYEFHGSPAAVTEQVKAVRGIADDSGGIEFTHATTAEQRSRLWRARHDALPAAKALRPGAGTWSTDVCVPISRLSECLLQTQRDIAEFGLIAPIAGHVGDGNFHLAIVLNPDDPDEMSRAHALNDAMVKRALALGGTCSGEHGIGLGKTSHLAQEVGDALSTMRAVKRALDPHGILNPGKLFAPMPN